METEPARVVRDFCAAWSRMQIDELMGYFAADAVYHNMPGPPVQGADAVRATIQRFLGGWTETNWEVRNLASEGSLVIAERVDHIIARTGRVDLPVVGVFEIEDGKIRAWRDYFDLTTYTRAMTPG